MVKKTTKKKPIKKKPSKNPWKVTNHVLLTDGKLREYIADAGLVADDELIIAAFTDFCASDFTQQQADVAAYWGVKNLEKVLTPQNYSFCGRVMIALHFLLNRKLKKKEKTNEK